jgi:DNA-binding winged helix-turn-helix (wHTH) protein
MDGTIPIEGGRVDLARREVVRGDARVELRAKEVELLRYLAERPGRTVPREELFERVWGYHPDTRSRTLDTTIRRLRSAIEVDPARPTHLQTEVGVGYRFVGAVADGSRAVLDDAVERVSTALRRPSRVVLWGPPGVGKRTLATAVAARLGGRPLHAAGDEPSRALAVALGVDPRGEVAALRARVEAARAGALLVLEEVPLEEVLALAPPVLARTTRRPPADPGYEAIQVEPLPREAARALLLSRGATDGPRLDTLLDALGGLPLALELVAAQLPFADAAALLALAETRPEQLFDDVVARTSRWARRRLDPELEAAADALGHLTGPVPTGLLAAVAGGLGLLARLRDQGWLAAAPGGWVVPASLRVGASVEGRERTVAALREWFASRVDEVCGPLSQAALAELVAVRPTLDALDHPGLAWLRVWATVSEGRPAAELATRARDAAPLTWALFAADPAEARLAVVEALAPSPPRDAVRARLLRLTGRHDALSAEQPSEREKTWEAPVPATGEWWYQVSQLAQIRGDRPRAEAAARAALQAWRGWPALEDRARVLLASFALVDGRLAQAEEAYAALVASPDPSLGFEGELGLAFVALLRGSADDARQRARNGEARIPRLSNAWAASAWNQLALVWRELGDAEATRRAVGRVLDLHAMGAGPDWFEGAAHTTLGASLLDQGRPAEALVPLRAARRVHEALGLRDRVAFAAVLEQLGLELVGDAPAWDGVPCPPGNARMRHLADGFRGAPTPEAAAFARDTFDPALAGVLAAAEGRAVPPETLATSLEARLAVRLAAHRRV